MQTISQRIGVFPDEPKRDRRQRRDNGRRKKNLERGREIGAALSHSVKTDTHRNKWPDDHGDHNGKTHPNSLIAALVSFGNIVLKGRNERAGQRQYPAHHKGGEHVQNNEVRSGKLDKI